MMDYIQNHILETLIYLPILASVIMMAINRNHVHIIRLVAVGSGALLLILSIYVFIIFDFGSDEGYQLLQTYAWLSHLGIDFRLGVDGIAAPMVLLTGIVIFACLLYKSPSPRDNSQDRDPS